MVLFYVIDYIGNKFDSEKWQLTVFMVEEIEIPNITKQGISHVIFVFLHPSSCVEYKNSIK